MKRILTIGLTILSMAFLCGGCSQQSIIGKGPIVSKVRQVSGSFVGVDIAGNFNVKIKAGQPQKVVLKTNENLYKYINTYVKGHILFVRVKKLVNIVPAGQQKLIISAPSINKVVSSGRSQLRVTGLTGKHIVLALSGSQQARLTGKTNSLLLHSSGNTDVDAKQLITDKAIVRISGDGKVGVNARKFLTVRISGSGEVVYFGDPKHITQRITGEGAVSASKSK